MFGFKSLKASPLVMMVAFTVIEVQPGLRAAEIDLSHAVVVVPDGLSTTESKAVQVLVDEVRRRSRIGWDTMIRWPTRSVPVIAVGPARLLDSFPKEYLELVSSQPAGKEQDGFLIQTVNGAEAAPVVAIVGNDARGLLFGVGRLLRELRVAPGRVVVPESLNLASAPKYPLRGHQLGYRPKTNSYDAWDLPQWDRYIRELAIFGTNAIELIPPRSDDAADQPALSVASHGDDGGHVPDLRRLRAGRLDLVSGDGRRLRRSQDGRACAGRVGGGFQEAAANRRRLRAGGRPGHTRPKVLMALLEKQAENLHRYHPKAKMWVSPQSFSREWFDEFLKLMSTEPAWLAGVVFGPQVRVSLPELRKALPAKYPIRDYPDITHSLRCQYPVPDWDVAYSLTEGREVINPRPRDEATIFHAFADQTIGFITYSEGCNDDVNKIVWSALGWDPQADVFDVLRDFGRCLIGLSARRGRRFRPRALCARTELAWAAAVEQLGGDDARAVPLSRTARLAPCAGRLAISAGSLPCLLRRLRAQSPDLRDRPRTASARSPARGTNERFTRGD